MREDILRLILNVGFGLVGGAAAIAAWVFRTGGVKREVELRLEALERSQAATDVKLDKFIAEAQGYFRDTAIQQARLASINDLLVNQADTLRRLEVKLDTVADRSARCRNFDPR